MLKNLGFVATACFLMGCNESETLKTSSSGDTNLSASATNVVAAPAVFNDLKGKWARTDGDYMLEITGVAADGKMDAGYFNPNPIHISKAVAIKESSGTKVFVELQDEGYPGCTYSLTYDPSTSQLHGQYFQAAQQQTYDVVFAKLKE